MLAIRYNIILIITIGLIITSSTLTNSSAQSNSTPNGTTASVANTKESIVENFTKKNSDSLGQVDTSDETQNKVSKDINTDDTDGAEVNMGLIKGLTLDEINAYLAKTTKIDKKEINDKTNNQNQGKDFIKQSDEVNPTQGGNKTNNQDNSAIKTESSSKILSKQFSKQGVKPIESKEQHLGILNKFNKSDKSINTADKATQLNIDQFMYNELVTLLLPNDDVVLGQVSQDAQLKYMDLLAYIDSFNKFIQKKKSRLAAKSIDSFIEYYYPNMDHDIILDYDEDQILNSASNAIKHNDLFLLKALLDHYPILQSSNAFGNTLLHQTVKYNQYFLTKLLLMRGANLSATNILDMTPLMLAIQTRQYNIALLLHDAIID